MPRAIKILLIIVVVVGLGIWLFSGTDSQTVDNATSTPDTTEDTADIPADWETYESEAFGFSIAHPVDVTLQIEGPNQNHTKITYIGSDNEPNTEITDGFTLTISSYSKADANAENLRDFVDKQIETNPAAETVSEPIATTFNGREAISYETENLGTVEHVAFETTDAYIIVSQNIADPNNEGFADMVATMKDTLTFTAEDSATVSAVDIALLNSDIPEGQEPERGCDLVEMVSRDIEPTAAPLTAAMEELFSLEEETIEGYTNFIARTNDTLSFDRATVVDSTANIYLTGELSGLAGVCDNPRAKIQIEETALQFATVNDVQIYLDGELTELQPDGRGE